MHTSTAKQRHIDVDKYTNPWTPRNHVYLLPKPIAHFLGHRDRPEKEVGNVIVAAWALLGAFVGIVVMAAAFMIPEIQSHAPPVVIGSFVRSSPLHMRSGLISYRELPQFLNTIRLNRHLRSPGIASSVISSLLPLASPSRSCSSSVQILKTCDGWQEGWVAAQHRL